MIVRYSLCVGAAAALFSLSSFASKEPARTPTCVTTPAQLNAVDLTTLFLKHRGNLDVEPADGCLQVGDPPKELAAVRLALPVFAEPYAVRIAAPVGKSMFLPRVTFLDEQYRTTRSFGADAKKRRGTQMSLEVFIDPPNADEKYLLVYPDPAHIGDTDRRTVSRTDSLFVGTGVIFVGSEVGSNVTAEETGEITVSLIGERFEKMRRGK